MQLYVHKLQKKQINLNLTLIFSSEGVYNIKYCELILSTKLEMLVDSLVV